MTAILVLRTKGKTYIAADSRMVMSNDDFYDGQKKLFKVGPGIVGFSDWSRTASVIEKNIAVLSRVKTPAAFADKMAELYLADGWVSGSTNSDSYSPRGFQVQFLLATKNGAYHVDASMSCSRLPEGFVYGIGSGSTAARAAALVYLQFGTDPRSALVCGIETACEIEHSIGKPVFSEVV